MKKDVVLEIQRFVEQHIGIKPQLIEPDFSNPQVYPCAWLEIEETPWEGLQQLSKRNTTINVYFADRCLPAEADERLLQLIELADALEKAVILNQKHQFDSGILQFRFKTARVQSVREIGSGFVLIGIFVQLQTIYDQEV